MKKEKIEIKDIKDIALLEKKRTGKMGDCSGTWIV